MSNYNRLKQLGRATCTVSKWCSNSVQPDLKTFNKIVNFFAY